jgi:RNA polymerase sigma-70 factor, ECF subfamily
MLACGSRIAPSPEVRDEPLERAFERRDAVGYEMAYHRFGARLHAVALRALHDPESAGECVHDVFLKLWKSGSYARGRGSLEAFLVVCVRNRALMHLRSTARARSSLARLEPPGAYTIEEDPIERARIERAVSRLTDGQGDVVELAYYRGLTLSEVARELAIPIGTVKARLSAALRALRRSLVEGADGV